MARSAMSMWRVWARSRRRHRLPPALSSGANCTRGLPSFPTGSAPERGARSWARCMLGSLWSHRTNNAMPSDDHRLLESPALARSHRRHARFRANRTLSRHGLRAEFEPSGLWGRSRDPQTARWKRAIIPLLLNDPQPEGHMASYVARRKFLATLGGAAARQTRRAR